jgi:hypothetical protein
MLSHQYFKKIPHKSCCSFNPKNWEILGHFYFSSVNLTSFASSSFPKKFTKNSWYHKILDSHCLWEQASLV